LLIAKWQQATSWFQPELLKLPLATVRQWMETTPGLDVYRFAIEEVFRLQEHVLNEQGERLLSLTERLGSVPKDSYAALSTADARFPTITLSTGESTEVSYGQYRKLLATCRLQDDRKKAYEALYDTYTASLNTYAAIYNGVMHGDWFEARARGYASTLDAALFGNAIPTSVVENLIRETKNGVAPFRRYHQLRKRVLNLADHADLFAERPDKTGDDHRHDRIPDVLRKRLFDVAGKRRRILANGREVFDERSRDFAVRPHRNAHRQLGVAPNNDIHAVARSDDPVVVCRRGGCRRRRVCGRTAEQKCSGDGSREHAKQLEHNVDPAMMHTLLRSPTKRSS